MVHKHRVAKLGPKTSPYFSTSTRMVHDFMKSTIEPHDLAKKQEAQQTTTQSYMEATRTFGHFEKIPIDENGDLVLLCGNKAFRVDTHIMRRASQQFAALIDDSTTIVLEASPKFVLCPTSEATAALEVLLHIMHLNFRSVPSDLRLQTLARLTHLCLDFGTLHLLKPFQEGWIKRHDIAADDTGMGNARVAALAAVTWTLGLHTIFQRIALNQLQQAIVQGNQSDLESVIQRYMFGNDHCEWAGWIHGMLPVLQQVYKEALQELLGIFWHAFDHLRGDDFVCRVPEEYPKSGWSAWNQQPRWGFSNIDDDEQLDQARRKCKIAMLRNYLQWVSELKRNNGITIDMVNRKIETTKGLRLVDIFECHQSAQVAFRTVAGHEECHIGGDMLDSACKVLNGIPTRIRQLHQAWIEDRDKAQTSPVIANEIAGASDTFVGEAGKLVDMEEDAIKQEERP